MVVVLVVFEWHIRVAHRFGQDNNSYTPTHWYKILRKLNQSARWQNYRRWSTALPQGNPTDWKTWLKHMSEENKRLKQNSSRNIGAQNLTPGTNCFVFPNCFLPLLGVNCSVMSVCGFICAMLRWTRLLGSVLKDSVVTHSFIAHQHGSDQRFGGHNNEKSLNNCPGGVLALFPPHVGERVLIATVTLFIRPVFCMGGFWIFTSAFVRPRLWNADLWCNAEFWCHRLMNPFFEMFFESNHYSAWNRSGLYLQSQGQSTTIWIQITLMTMEKKSCLKCMVFVIKSFTPQQRGLKIHTFFCIIILYPSTIFCVAQR